VHTQVSQVAASLCGGGWLQASSYDEAAAALQRQYLRNNKVVDLREHV
jgi:hypothetical protein